MTLQETIAALESMGSASTRKIWDNHGAREPYFGVKVGDLKTLVKKIKRDHALALQLFDTQNADAQYLAGLIADPSVFSENDLHRWAKNANWYIISEYPVAWMAAESPHAWSLALQWIDAPEPHVASAGWATLSHLVHLKSDADLDVAALAQLLDRVADTIGQAEGRVKYTMNGFVIAVGSCVVPLSEKAEEIARQNGKIHVFMPKVNCQVPDAAASINKIRNAGKLGKKKKTVVC